MNEKTIYNDLGIQIALVGKLPSGEEISDPGSIYRDFYYNATADGVREFIDADRSGVYIVIRRN